VDRLQQPAFFNYKKNIFKHLLFSSTHNDNAYV
jgi:hypothetical protein